jgi:dienelactone hydrolase
LLAVAAVVAAAVAGVAWLLRDPLPHFIARRSTLARAAVDSTAVEDGYHLDFVTLQASSGLRVELTVRRALADSGAKLPLVVGLGGYESGRAAIRWLGDTRGVVVATLAYPFTGHVRPSALTFVREIPLIRRAMLDTPPAVMLALDYLLTRSDVDTARVEAVGVSLGAPFMCIAAALDSRFTRAWAVHGSGGSYAPLEANMRRTIRFAPVRRLAAVVANVIIAGPRLDPVRWVGRITPRPFVMVNAEGDEQMPREAVEALHRAAGVPKELRWIPGGHVRPDRAVIQSLAGIVMQQIREDATARPQGRTDAGK